MNVLKCGLAIVGKADGLAISQPVEYVASQVASRIDRIPPRTCDVSRVEDRRGKSGLCFTEQEPLDFRLANSIITERLTRFILVVWPAVRVAVHPECTAVNEVSNAPAERVDEMQS